MSEYIIKLLGFSIFVFISLFRISSSEYVPVYMWETTQFSEVVPALERVSPESFKNILTERAGKDVPILLFAEQNLSPEDLILHDNGEKTPFTHLSSLKGSAQISYWPSVMNPIEVVKRLPDRKKIKTTIKAILQEEDVTVTGNDVLFVDLNDAREGENRLQMLKRHDKDIATVYEKLSKEYKNILTLYTGHHSSWITSEELRSHRRVRDTGNPEPQATEKKEEKAEEAHTYKLYNNSDVMIFANSTPILSYNGKQVSFDDFNMKTSSKNETDVLILFSSEKVKDITVTFPFKFGKGYWSMSDIMVSNADVPEKEYTLRVKQIFAPKDFSYHCYSQMFYNGTNPNLNLSLPGFQVQPFVNGSNSSKFGEAYDCVGFTSAPIWSGLFVTLILALIMTFGLTMMMDIKTMDRFDDPKGKTITIGAIE